MDVRHQPVDRHRPRVLHAGPSGSRFGHPWAPPGGHRALFAVQNAAPYSGYGAALPPAPAYGAAAAPAYGAAPTYGAATTAFGAAPAPAYGGSYSPQVPPPWDPALLAALHSAPSPSSYGGGGDWYMDSGATAHMTAHPGNLTSATRVHTPTRITVGNGSSLPITHVGHMSFPSTSTHVHMSNVFVSPDLVLISFPFVALLVRIL